MPVPYNNASQLDQLWTADDVAQFIARSKKWVYRMALEGRIPHISISPGTVRFDPDDIRRWVESCKEIGGNL